VSEPADQDLIVQTVYDAAGRQVQTVTPAGQVTQFAYDNLDRLIAVTENIANGACPLDPCNVVTAYQYDRAGNRTAMIDANGHVRRFTFDAANQPVAAIDALNQTTGYAYDAGGRLVSTSDPRGSSNDLTYSYDGLDRQTSVSATNLGTISQSYDARGQRTSLVDATGTTSFQYDQLGHLTQVDAPNTGIVGYGYDAAGRRTQLTYPDTSVIEYTYLADGQLDTVADGSTTLASYSYDSAGRLADVTRANGSTTTYAYDAADRVRDIHTTVSSATTTRFQYTVDRAGLRTQATEAIPGAMARTVTYSYDGLQRLTGAIEAATAPLTATTVFSYTYDDAGNRTGVWQDGLQTQNLSYNAANQVVGWTYDAAGNLLSDGTTSYAYDALSRVLTRGSTSNSYNGDGVLVAQTTGSSTISYTQDLAAPLSRILSDGTNRYIYGNGAERLFGVAGSTRTWYSADALGSVRATLDQSGIVQASANYDPWGVPETAAIAPFGFTGELQQGGDVWLRARWYAAGNGVFRAFRSRSTRRAVGRLPPQAPGPAWRTAAAPAPSRARW
jgi:YD repeat-containing protein